MTRECQAVMRSVLTVKEIGVCFDRPGQLKGTGTGYPETLAWDMLKICLHHNSP